MYGIVTLGPWSSNGTLSNLRRHKVSFHDAATVFGDPLSSTAPDPYRAFREQRYITIGMSQRRRLLIVSHSDSGERVRIISARTLNRRERKTYEEIFEWLRR